MLTSPQATHVQCASFTLAKVLAFALYSRRQITHLKQRNEQMITKIN